MLPLLVLGGLIIAAAAAQPRPGRAPTPVMPSPGGLEEALLRQMRQPSRYDYEATSGKWSPNLAYADTRESSDALERLVERARSRRGRT